jgi:hypothetical protein
MAWTDHLIAIDRPAGEDAAIMGTDVLDRVELTLDVEHRNLRPVDIDDAMRAGREFGRGGDWGPIRHGRP